MSISKEWSVGPGWSMSGTGFSKGSSEFYYYYLKKKPLKAGVSLKKDAEQSLDLQFMLLKLEAKKQGLLGEREK
ncbi:MAG: hypothetical protein WC325_12140 [Candidatus Bathyarchaeia archaeon]|jgi:hypothetical protein